MKWESQEEVPARFVSGGLVGLTVWSQDAITATLTLPWNHSPMEVPPFWKEWLEAKTISCFGSLLCSLFSCCSNPSRGYKMQMMSGTGAQCPKWAARSCGCSKPLSPWQWVLLAVPPPPSPSIFSWEMFLSVSYWVWIKIPTDSYLFWKRLHKWHTHAVLTAK